MEMADIRRDRGDRNHVDHGCDRLIGIQFVAAASVVLAVLVPAAFFGHRSRVQLGTLANLAVVRFAVVFPLAVTGAIAVAAYAMHALHRG